MGGLGNLGNGPLGELMSGQVSNTRGLVHTK